MHTYMNYHLHLKIHIRHYSADIYYHRYFVIPLLCTKNMIYVYEFVILDIFYILFQNNTFKNL